MNTKPLLILIFISFFSTGCLFDSSVDVKNDVPSKEEIEQRKKDGDTKDYCEIFNWYGDGKCDDFCINQDSDCAVTCGALPRCPDGTIEVVGCFDPGNCEEIEICQTTIYCEPEPFCEAFDAVIIECPAGYLLGDVCDSSDPETPCIDLTDRCSGPIFCNPDRVTCLAFPVCETGYFEVERCKLADPECQPITICDETISCSADLGCDAIPSCANDEIMYGSKIDCENGGQACRQDYDCGSVIWCGGNEECRAPECGAQPPVPECDDPEKCYEIFGCGQSTVCETGF